MTIRNGAIAIGSLDTPGLGVGPGALRMLGPGGGMGAHAAAGAAATAAAAASAGAGVAAASGGPAGGDLDRGAYDKMFAGTPLAGQYDAVVKAAPGAAGERRPSEENGGSHPFAESKKRQKRQHCHLPIAQPDRDGREPR